MCNFAGYCWRCQEKVVPLRCCAVKHSYASREARECLTTIRECLTTTRECLTITQECLTTTQECLTTTQECLTTKIANNKFVILKCYNSKNFIR